ncbi:T9SS type A sorting domain-containing protein [Salegentibacter sp. BDJ18]|uniref:LamG-like jellyroll fold domain-containing protein n=1 Tax=Salegentibacter sp. BDJ18 TaxID=2816376 RepID=UPI001AAEE887|nr:LamG-like jellyroll fold domain-containing protein [Salegentibacter sp. BDJ18]MBO2542812.1 T9SS type A sorting domain-containing protein [Salegentibacter sp. BDJ18]
MGKILLLIFIIVPLGIYGQACPNSLSISSNNGKEICAGEEVTFSATVDTGSNLNYQWQINSTNTGTNAAEFTTTTLSHNDRIKVIVTSSDDAECNLTSDYIQMTVNTVRVGSIVIEASPTEICPGDLISFNIASSSNTGTNPDYQWQVNGEIEGSGNSFSGNLVEGDNVQLLVSSSLPCTEDFSSNVISVSEKDGPPASIGNIQGEISICPGISTTYNISAVNFADSYIWELPEGWDGSSTGTSIEVTTGSQGGEISVRAINDCGETEQTLSVNVEPGAPTQPGGISGNTEVCPGTPESYSISEVPNAESYQWIVPSDWSGSSTTNTIDLTTGNPGNAILEVIAINSCGESISRELNITVQPDIPNTPGNISGENQVCPGIIKTYSISQVPDAESYNWTVPAGWTINGDANSNQISVTTGNYDQNGNISVTAVNSCGESEANILAVNVDYGTPPLPGEISLQIGDGFEVICPESSLSFSISEMNEAESYTWDLPQGWTIVSGQGTPQIQVTSGQYGESGEVSVSATNNCGTGNLQTLEVNIDPPAPVIENIQITGEVEVCADATQLEYSIPQISYADSYEWSLPSGWVITSEENTNSIIVSASPTSGNIEVFAINECGDSEITSLAVTAVNDVPNQPGTISTDLGIDAICPPRNDISFSVPNDSEVDYYRWILPSGWEIVSGENTNAILVNVTNSAPYSNEIVKVVAGNICGESTESQYSEITVSDFVVTDLGENQDLCSTTTAVPINVTIEFGGFKKFKPAFSHNGWGSFTNIPPITNNYPNNFTIQYIPTSADFGQEVTVVVNVPEPETNKNDPDACGDGYAEVTLYFAPNPTASFLTENHDICENSTTDITLSGTPNTQITYTENGTTKTIDLNENGEAIFNSGNLTESTIYELVSTSYQEEPTCVQTLSESLEITVNPVPSVELVYEESIFCEDDDQAKSVTFENTIGAYENGTFSAEPGLQIDPGTGTISPSSSEPGDYNITYTIPASVGCELVLITTTMSIKEIPQVDFSYETPMCSAGDSAKEVTLSGSGNYQNGSFTADAGLSIDANTGTINPSDSTPGTYTVTYTTPATDGCNEYNFTSDVVITEIPTPEITYDFNEFCKGDSSTFTPAITGGGAITGGTFSSTSGLAVNTETGEINPANSEPGTYTMTYVLEASAGCETVSTETEILITELPTATLNYAGPFCVSNNTPQQINFSEVSGTIAGGTFSASPVGLSINENSGDILPGSSDPGNYIVTYTVAAAGGCDEVLLTTNVSITEVPYASISYNAPFCSSNSENFPVNFEETPELYKTGTFSGSTGLVIDSEGNINPAASAAGEHTITYTLPEFDACEPSEVTTTILIYEAPAITSQPFSVGICSTEPSELSVVATGDELQYQWFRDGEAASEATEATLSFNNTTSQNAGEYYVEVSGPAGCAPVTSESVSLNVNEDIIIEEPVTEVPICGDGFSEVTMKFIAHANGAPLTFTWYKGNAVVDDSDENITITTQPADENGRYAGTLEIINVTTNYNGDYYVEVQGPAEFTCSTAVTNPFQLRLNEVPEPPTVANFEYCQYEEAPALSVLAGENLTWYATETGDDAFPETPVPSTDEPGETIYWVTQTPDVCESERIAVSVNIKEKPAAPETTIVIEYCEGETANPLEAVVADSASLNWYDAEENLLSEAPLPNTESIGMYQYYVSQSLNDCESDKVAIEVIIHELPEVTITSSETLVCAASLVTLTVEGADTYVWYNEADEEIGTTASLEVNPEITTTYKVVGTGTGECSTTAEITIEVDQPSDAGTIAGETNVCTGNNSGEIALSGINGEVIRWEFTEDNGETWEIIDLEESEISTSYTYQNLVTTTGFRAAVQNGVCEETISETIYIQVDERPIGGELNFAGFDRLYTTCEDPEFLEDLVLSGHTGQVVAWKYRTASQASFQTIPGENSNVLSSAIITGLVGTETLIFQAEIVNGSCTNPVVSRTAILSVISSNIEPAPVTVSENLICLGADVTLSAETGYQSGDGVNDSGNFDNASINQQGWRIINSNGVEENFETSANNTAPNVWRRVTPREFITANLTSPYNTSMQRFDHGLDDGNKGFSLVSGNNTSTMETNVFALDGLDSGILTFDQAYNLTDGASIEVLISTNGGSTYTSLYNNNGDPSSGNYNNFASGTPISRPENKIEIDVGDYIGQNNLRIMFSYVGARQGDVWAIDNIILPDGPQNVGVVWEDTTDPDTPVIIGTNNSEIWEPTEIGWNVSVITTTLEYTGGSCATATNNEEIRVFVYDQYTSTVQAETGSCGVYSAQLSATVSSETQGEITSYPTLDGYIGKWVVEGPEGYEFSNIDPNNESDPINNPNAIFTSQSESPESYTITWVLESTETDENGNLIENEACSPIYEAAEVVFEDCIALDFDGLDDYVDLGETYTGNYSLEAWIRPEASTGTIISGPNFEINFESLPTEINTNSRWYHIAVSNNTLYIDGIESGSFNLGNGGERTLIGASWNNTTSTAENYFTGWIEEVRIWNTAITVEQIRFMMNQRLYNNGTQMGVDIPMNVPQGLSFADLAGYYQLLAQEELVAGGTTPDLAQNAIPGKLKNMETLQENTAPLPYTSRIDGQTWTTINTWTHFEVWDAPNSTGINGDPIEWNIVRTSHNINSGNKDISVLGLISEEKELEISDPIDAMDEYNNGKFLRITHYLKLDGIINLIGESQLLQDEASILEEASSGYLERDQQGTRNSFNYNYWSSPVSAQGSSNNSPYTISTILRDGTNTQNPLNIDFRGGHAAADQARTSPIIISAYWLHAFNGRANQYGDWEHIGANGTLNTGEGFTMKGSSGTASILEEQNYVFTGKPHNGRIELNIGPDMNYLVGNPYPSALNANEFILDNLKDVTDGRNSQNVFNGVVYFWDHFGAENTHILREYVGGYAAYSLAGGVQAISNDYRINANDAKGTKTPQQFIPVGQGFFLNTRLDEENSGNITIAGGDVIFKNSQRQGVRENVSSSIFLQPLAKSKNIKAQDSDERAKIRLKFHSPKGYHRQILVTRDVNTSNGFDLGYDAPLIENNQEDMYWLIDSSKVVIQGVPNFNTGQVLPIGVKIAGDGYFKIHIDSLENFPDEIPVYLNDKLLDTVHDLKEKPYDAISQLGRIHNRFQIIFKNIKAIPEIPEKPDLSSTIDFKYNDETYELRIDNPELIEISEVHVFDLSGKLVQTHTDIPLQKQNILVINPVGASVYIVKLITADGNRNKKFIMK